MLAVDRPTLQFCVNGDGTLHGVPQLPRHDCELLCVPLPHVDEQADHALQPDR